MRVTLVPSSIALDGEEPNQSLISYVINDTLAIDAGSLGLYGSPRRQAAIKHVLISHTHIDHTATLPIFIENAYEADAECVTIHGSDDVLDCLRHHMFNDRTWPDFVALSESETGLRLLRLERLEPGEPIALDGLKITPIPVDHVVPTLGFLVEDDHSAVVIASDTGPTDLLWQRANAVAHLDAVFLEAAFPNAMAALAGLSKHLTPELFGREIGKLSNPVDVVAVHIKARFRDQIVGELHALGLPRLEIGVLGKAYQW